MSGIRLCIPVVVALIAGCATDIPVPQSHPPSTQAKLRAAHHWDILAADIAAQIEKQLVAYAPVAALYVEAPLNRSPFEVAMHDFVITHLVKDGVPVDLKGGGALQVSLATQLIFNVSKRDIEARVPLAALAGGIMVAYNVALHANPEFLTAAALGSAGAYDLLSDRLTRPGAPSSAELIVTTSVSNNARFLMRKTDVYYIEDVDLGLFVTPPPPPPPTPTREYKVEGSK